MTDLFIQGSGSNGILMLREPWGEDRIMFRTLCLAGVCALVTLAGVAQDTQFRAREQQIPPPECMNLRFAWEGQQVTCPPFMHDRWLRDLEHWRMERRIRIAYDPSRYDMPDLR
jgi:hypothetical protein